MTLHMNVGEIRYCPARDIIYLFPGVIETVAARLEDAPFKPLHCWLQERNVSLEDLGHALGCYIKYMNAAHADPDKKMWDVLQDSGWNDCKPEAQIAVMFYTGIILTGTFFKGVRDAIPLGGKTIPEVSALLEAGRKLDAFIALPPGRRWLYGKYKWLRHLFLRGKMIRIET